MDKLEIQNISEDISRLRGIFKELIKILPAFSITDEKILPYGLKPHTRSVSWIVEQVIVQQTKYNAKKLGLIDVDFSMPDTCLHDCVIKTEKDIYYVNVKISNAGEKKQNKNDIAAVEKLYMQYNSNPAYNLIYACFGIHFQNVNIHFDPDYLYVFSPQFLPIYVNPRNDKIQAYYKHPPQYRTREKFLSLLQKKSKSIVLK
ncbi:MAG: hypothetical protein WC947_03275 [Elusimicrobiota bacterium]